jgi:hypothetical protein
MILEIFGLALIALKAFALIKVTWTFVIIISLALVVVEVRLHLHRKAILTLINCIADTTDGVVDDLRYQISNKQDRDY